MIAAAVVLGLVLLAIIVRSPSVVLLRRRRRRVIVTMKTGESFTGVLWQADHRAVVLRNAQLLERGDAQAVPVDGEVLVQCADVSFVQLP